MDHRRLLCFLLTSCWIFRASAIFGLMSFLIVETPRLLSVLTSFHVSLSSETSGARVRPLCPAHLKRSAFSSSAFVDSPADRLLTVPHPHLLCVMNSQCHIYIFLILELSSVLFCRFISSLKCSTFPVVFSISFPYFLLSLF